MKEKSKPSRKSIDVTDEDQDEMDWIRTRIREKLPAALRNGRSLQDAVLDIKGGLSGALEFFESIEEFKQYCKCMEDTLQRIQFEYSTNKTIVGVADMKKRVERAIGSQLMFWETLREDVSHLEGALCLEIIAGNTDSISDTWATQSGKTLRTLERHLDLLARASLPVSIERPLFPPEIAHTHPPMLPAPQALPATAVDRDLVRDHMTTLLATLPTLNRESSTSDVLVWLLEAATLSHTVQMNARHDAVDQEVYNSIARKFRALIQPKYPLQKLLATAQPFEVMQAVLNLIGVGDIHIALSELTERLKTEINGEFWKAASTARNLIRIEMLSQSRDVTICGKVDAEISLIRHRLRMTDGIDQTRSDQLVFAEWRNIPRSVRDLPHRIVPCCNYTASTITKKTGMASHKRGNRFDAGEKMRAEKENKEAGR